MSKCDQLDWFLEIMKNKMLRHKEDPNLLTEWEIIDWLEKEVAELKEALTYKSRENIIHESGDVGNLAYFLARKVKGEWPR